MVISLEGKFKITVAQRRAQVIFARSRNGVYLPVGKYIDGTGKTQIIIGGKVLQPGKTTAVTSREWANSCLWQKTGPWRAVPGGSQWCQEWDYHSWQRAIKAEGLQLRAGSFANKIYSDS